MKKLRLMSLLPLLAIGACKSKKDISTPEIFQVITPIISDTVFNHEYVADIQAIENVEIRARVSGFLDKIHVDEGAYVKEGQPLFSISSREYQEEVLKCTALLKVAEADVKLAQLEVQNTETLVKKNIVSKTELDKNKAKLEALEAKVDEAKANLSSAQLNLSYTTVKAPFNGIINRIPNKRGSLIEEGTLLTSINNDDEVFVYFRVSEREYLEIINEEKHKGKLDVKLILANDKVYPYNGNIETVESEINKSTGNLAFRARFSNKDKILKHGASGKIIVPQKISNAMLIPQRSTFEIQENVYVYAIDERNTVKMKKINPVLRLPHVYIIDDGLSEKERFIYEGIQRVKEGNVIIPEIVKPKEL